MKNNQTLIFDFDGTIADSHKYVMEFVKKLSQKYLNRILSENEIDDLRHKWPKQIIKDLGISVFKLPKIILEAQNELAKSINLVKPFKGMKEVISDLDKKGILLGIVSTNSRENIEIFLKKNGMNLFDFIYSSPAIFGKAARLKKAIKEKKLNIDKVVYIGDEIRDIEAARKIRIKVAAVAWGFNPPEVLKKYQPDFLINKPSDLLQIIPEFLTAGRMP